MDKGVYKEKLLKLDYKLEINRISKGEYEKELSILNNKYLGKNKDVKKSNK